MFFHLEPVVLNLMNFEFCNILRDFTWKTIFSYIDSCEFNWFGLVIYNCHCETELDEKSHSFKLKWIVWKYEYHWYSWNENWFTEKKTALWTCGRWSDFWPMIFYVLQDVFVDIFSLIFDYFWIWLSTHFCNLHGRAFFVYV